MQNLGNRQDFVGTADQSCRRLLRHLVLPLALLAATGVAAVSQASTPATVVDQGKAQMQVHRTWFFAADGVTFDNRMEGARLNGVERLGSDRYAVTIAPENTPINPSAWYGFSVRAAQPRQITIQFRYRHGEPRYWPKLSRDGGAHWQAAAAGAFRKLDDGRTELTVDASPQPLRIFAQRPVGSDDFRHWENGLRGRVAPRSSVIGHSVQGRPLRMLSFGNAQAKAVLVVIGRQHPPEVTGSQALMGFIDAVAADTPQARRFRSRVLTLVVPVLNPDGVAEGNWRDNADGVDLNRDWGGFAEPETRAVRDALVREVDEAGRHVVFAIDFHSTWKDVFYTVSEDPSRAPGGVLRQWMDGMQQRYPGRIREKAHAADTPVFKNWAFNRYRAPTVTYEVGDRTSAAQLDELARFAADSLMSLLQPSKPD